MNGGLITLIVGLLISFLSFGFIIASWLFGLGSEKGGGLWSAISGHLLGMGGMALGGLIAIIGLILWIASLIG